MKILITSGGTREFIDDVRVLTNISTGALGSIIADKCFEAGHEVHYVYTQGSIMPKNTEIINHTIEDVDSLMIKMMNLAPSMDVIIHAMAVSDFGFKSINAKLKSNNKEEFINSLRDRIKVNPKVLSYIKKWSPNSYLISFKFEVGQTHKDLLDIAYKSLENNNCDLVIANDKNEMVIEGKHIAYIQDKHKNVIKCNDKNEIANEIVRAIKNNGLKW
jgi:phosphopantothenate-cysteine ligase